MAMLGPFVDARYALIPLRIGAKTPAHVGWQTRNYSRFDLERWLAVGGNVGIRLTATDLVIDVDPRNFADGDDPLTRLSEMVGTDLGDMPATITGSGGRHLFCKKPAEVLIVGRLAGYEGIDFKSIGGLVVAPGSIHPETGQLYRTDPDATPLFRVEHAPPALLKLIRKPDRPADRFGAKPGVLEPEQLAVLLEVLDPADFGQGHYDRWLRLAAACHDATNGHGLEEFAEWCARDPEYGDVESYERVARHWESFTAGKPSGATYRTLLREVIDAGGADVVASLGINDNDRWSGALDDFMGEDDE
jgi:hypothetical protein